MDDGRIGDEMTLEGIAKQLEGIREELKGARSDVKAVDGKVDSLDHKMTIEFEETRRVVNLGFENVQMLDEKVDRRFNETDRAHADHKSLLEAAFVGLSRDVKRATRRRAGS
ncbi:MAG: hypothetical protein WC815_16500 [Vicinamibacterales bacterium]|jgi:archaellum component FlaC